MKIVQIGAIAALLAAAVAFAGVGRPGSAHGAEAAPTRGVTVNGTADVRAVPNEASFTFGVNTDASTAKAASTANTARAQQVIAALREAGVAKGDVQTQDVSVSPHWSDSGRVDGFTAHSS